MTVEIRPGPGGVDGGEPFPAVQAEMNRMRKLMPVMRLMRVLPDKANVMVMRKMMGFDNRDIAGNRVETTLISIPGPGGTVPARVYTPKGDDLPIMVFFHGGGWIGGSVGVVENICRSIADRAGHIVINVDYRLAPEHKFPAGLEDAYSAVEYAASRGRELGGDTSRLVVAGDSAGGNFATVCCLLAHQRGGPAISHQLLIYPGVDMSGAHQDEHGAEDGPPAPDFGDFMTRQYVDDQSSLSDPRCSPWLIEDPSFMPPATIITAEYCFLREQGEHYGDRLAASGVPTRTIRYNGLNHAFLDKIGVWPQAEACIDDMAEALTS
ncbi:MAG: alpha/beta hydrolase [Actinomycetia bacterium]|nr:alpha/beta hydrolase [Actinomycetes bacterium]